LSWIGLREINANLRIMFVLFMDNVRFFFQKVVQNSANIRLNSLNIFISPLGRMYI